MSVAMLSVGAQLPVVTVVTTSATRYFVGVYADRQPSQLVSSEASSAAWLVVAATGACTVSESSAVAPLPAVARAVMRKSTSAGSATAVAVGVALGVGRAPDVDGAAFALGLGCGVHPVSAIEAASNTATAAHPSTGLVIRTPVSLQRMVGR